MNGTVTDTPTIEFSILEGCVEEPTIRLARETYRSFPSVGGIVSFEGRVRDHHQGKSVTALSYSAYRDLALHEGRAILDEACGRFGLDFAMAFHAVGELSIGDMAVWIQSGAPHRDEAFDSCRFIIDEIKRRLPIWKHEHYEDGSHDWVYCAH